MGAAGGLFPWALASAPASVSFFFSRCQGFGAGLLFSNSSRVKKEKQSITLVVPILHIMAWPLLLSAAGGALVGAGAMLLKNKNKKR